MCYNAFGAVAALAGRRRQQRWTNANRWNEFATEQLVKMLGRHMTAKVSMFIACNNRCQTSEDVARAEEILIDILKGMTYIKDGWKYSFHFKKRDSQRSIEICKSNVAYTNISSRRL